MTIITGITDQPKQQTSIVLPDGTKAVLYLEYRPQQNGWYYNLTYGPNTRLVPFVLNGQRLVSSPNIMRQFRNLIPFGIAILTQNNIEPTRQTDFIDGTITMLLLDTADVAQVEAQVYTGNL